MTKLAANRANAQHSTGPKDTTKTRFNGVQHGLTSKQTVIPGESQEEYDEFHTEFLRDLNPRTAIERTLAERAGSAAWRLKRFQRIEAAFYNDRINAYLKDNPEADPAAALANLFVDPAEIAKTKLFLRYQNSVHREFDKAITEFGKARAEREKQQFEEAMLQAARQRQAPQNKAAAAAVGFASHDTREPADESEKYFTVQRMSATLNPCSNALQP
jgi:hypothetical protein